MRMTMRLLVTIVAMGVVLVSMSPAGATDRHVTEREHKGKTIVTVNEVGNQAFPYQWVRDDARRHADHGSTIYYRVDATELPDGISFAEVEQAIDSAAATFNAMACGAVELVREDVDPTADLGFVQHELDHGGSDEPLADITFAGWVPSSFFEAIGVPANGLSVPIVFDDDLSTLRWGVDAFREDDEYSDVDGDGKNDMFATEIYFNADSTYVVDDPELGNTPFFIDLESIVLHELGHAMGMDHFGRTTFVFDEQGAFEDIILNPHSTPLMNTNNYFVQTELTGSDRGSFCGLYANWSRSAG